MSVQPGCLPSTSRDASAPALDVMVGSPADALSTVEGILTKGQRRELQEQTSHCVAQQQLLVKRTRRGGSHLAVVERGNLHMKMSPVIAV